MKDTTFIRKVTLKNYKSIAACDVQLQPLTFLVGHNGSGKSNFLDALRFVADALNSSLDHALRDRGGINEVRRRSHGHPTHFLIRLEFTLHDGSTGHYAFRIGARRRDEPDEYRVQMEECVIQKEYFRVNNGVVKTSVQIAPSAATGRLYLVNASGLPEFRPVYEALSRMGFYNLNPDKIRDLQVPDPGEMLARDGSNLTSVFAQLSPDMKQVMEEYLSIIVPGVRGIEVEKFGGKETLTFKQDVVGGKHPWRFLANNMSDGTLRVFGILVALFQGNQDKQKRISLVGIEKPEIAMHPAMVGVLLDEFRHAAHNAQIIITTHSPDLLDDKHLDVDSILAVESYNGNTVIAPVDDASRSVVRDRLFTPGELLRLDQLQPDATQTSIASGSKVVQLNLFDSNKMDSAETKKKEKCE